MGKFYALSEEILTAIVDELIKGYEDNRYGLIK